MNSVLSPKRVKGSKSGGGVITAATQNDLTSADFALPFFYYMEIAKNTVQAGYFSYTLQLPKGVINRIWVEFPRGCSGLAGLQIWRGVRQIFPLPEGVWLKSDNSILNFAFTHKVMTNPFEVELRGYNLDDTYSHTLWVGIEMRGEIADLTQGMKAFLNLVNG